MGETEGTEELRYPFEKICDFFCFDHTLLSTHDMQVGKRALYVLRADDHFARQICRSRYSPVWPVSALSSLPSSVCNAVLRPVNEDIRCACAIGARSNLHCAGSSTSHGLAFRARSVMVQPSLYRGARVLENLCHLILAFRPRTLASPIFS